MSTGTRIRGTYVEDGIVYPDDDGIEWGHTSWQTDWIVRLYGNLTWMYSKDPQAVVIARMNWYPVRGECKVYRTPNVMVVFGRSKCFRGSYIQWAEDNIPPQVVFEILPPEITAKELARMLKFYEEHGVEEYYVHDPHAEKLSVWIRDGSRLLEVPASPTFVSPRMGIRFESSPEHGLRVYTSEGRVFQTLAEFERDAKILREQIARSNLIADDHGGKAGNGEPEGGNGDSSRGQKPDDA